MANSKDDFLPGLLNYEAKLPVTAGARRAALLEREMQIAQRAPDDIDQAAEIRVDPARCKIWGGNGRVYGDLTEALCRDLIDSMLAENGQLVPAVVRRLNNDPSFDYEVLVGTRRHWSVSWLHAHNYPQIVFVAKVISITDEEAFRLADLENRVRSDLSDLERARNYSRALPAYFDNSQVQMAEVMKVSPGWLSKLLKMASLPDEIVAAFADPASINVRAGYELAVQAAGPRGKAMIAIANAVADEQREARACGLKRISAPTVERRLRSAAAKKTGKKPDSVLLRAEDGRPAITLRGRRGTVLTLNIDLDADVDRTTLIDGITRAIDIRVSSGKHAPKNVYS